MYAAVVSHCSNANMQVHYRKKERNGKKRMSLVLASLKKTRFVFGKHLCPFVADVVFIHCELMRSYKRRIRLRKVEHSDRLAAASLYTSCNIGFEICLWQTKLVDGVTDDGLKRDRHCHVFIAREPAANSIVCVVKSIDQYIGLYL